jgi:membrane fusion protein, multidrug efflux system
MDPLNGRRGRVVIFAGAAALGFMAGCAKKADQAPPPPDVNVVAVQQRDVPVTREWVGYLDGFVNAQIRAQVTGYLVKQDYKEGSAVKKGDLLFEIDPRPFEALLSQAQGALGQAQAQLGKADEDVKRYTPLAQDKAISQQELDDAVQVHLAAVASGASAQAGVDQARLNLSFTRIVSPVDGIAGIATAQIGDLVGPSTGALAMVSDVDPIKAYFPISEQAYLEFRGRDPNAPSIPAGIAFVLILADGSTYPLPGTFYAIDSTVDANTGTLKVVAVFPNPRGLLRPGQYARVRAVVSTEKGALVVPVRAISELQGSYQVATVDAENHAHIVTVTTGTQVGADEVVESGLHPGDRVVLDGVQKVKDGAPVNPVPAQAGEPAK